MNWSCVSDCTSDFKAAPRTVLAAAKDSKKLITLEEDCWSDLPLPRDLTRNGVCVQVRLGDHISRGPQKALFGKTCNAIKDIAEMIYFGSNAEAQFLLTIEVEAIVDGTLEGAVRSHAQGAFFGEALVALNWSVWQNAKISEAVTRYAAGSVKARQDLSVSEFLRGKAMRDDAVIGVAQKAATAVVKRLELGTTKYVSGQKQ